MKHIVSGIQRMINCRDVIKGIVVWDRTHELLQIAYDVTQEEESKRGRSGRG